MAPAEIPDVLQSSQSFVRALKSATDPPHENGLSKIQIARQGWDSQTLYVPRKADLLLEWILTRFHKEKSKQSPENPLLDTAHWSLLADILSRPGDAHIVSLITRISIPGLVSAFLALHHIVPDSSKHSLFPSILCALNVLWPLAAQRVALDPLLECVWQSLNVCNRIYRPLECDKLEELLALVFAAFRSALDNANAAGKKKVYLALVQHQLHPWLRAMHSLAPPHPLHEQLYLLGIEILFNADSLRTSLDTNPGASTGTDIFSSLFGSSIKWDQNIRTIFLELLPRVAKSYFLALRKHRSTIYTTSQYGQHTRSRHRDAGMRFGSACLAFLKDSEASREMVMRVWGARVGVLAILEEEAVFDNTGNSLITDEIKVVGSDIIKVLDNAWDKSHSALVAHALTALTCLHRIEPDILAPAIPQILERLTTCGAASGHPSIPFLSQLISYYAKTRTLHTFTSLLFASVTSTFSFLPRLNPRKLYATVARSSLLSLRFAEELSSSLRAFMTPGQANAIINDIHDVLESSFAALGAIESTRKRRKVSADKGLHEHSRVPDEKREYHLVKFALVARLGTTALSAVLLASIGENSTERRKKCLDRVDNLIASALETSFRIGTGDVQKAPGKRMWDEEIFPSSWSRECFSTGLLGLWYDLFARSSSPGMESEGRNGWVSTAVLFRLQDNLRSCLYANDTQPELQLEIGRVLFACRVSQRDANNLDQESWPGFDAILDYIESSLPGCDVGSTPDMSPETDVPFFDKKDTASALWSLTLGRYLHAVDMHASPTQLERLVDLMIRTLANSGDQTSGSSGFLLEHAMASASFWEFSNIQATLIACLERRTVGFSSLDFQEWLSALVQGDSKTIKALSKTINKSLNDIEDLTAVYRLLHCFPTGYLSRTFRVELAKRALVTDILISALNCRYKTPVLAGCQTVLRSFVVLGTTPLVKIFNEAEWVPYLFFSKQAPEEFSVNVTMNLLSLIYTSWLRAASSELGREDPLASVLAYFMASKPFLNGGKSETLAQQSIQRFMRTLVEFKITSFSANLRDSFRSLCMDLDDCLRPAIRAILSQPTPSEFLQSGHIIEAWQALLSFKQWLLIQPEWDTTAKILLQKTGKIIKSSKSPDVSDKFRTSVLSLVMRQGQIFPEDGFQNTGIIASAYMLFTTSTPSKVSLCDGLLTATIKNLSVNQFEAFLEFVTEAMEIRPNERSEAELKSLMHLSELLLRDAPERTSKISHEHAARCLRVFVGRPAFADGSSTLIAQILDFIHFQCTERAAWLKASDIACIWSILARTLRGSGEHDDRTSPSIFQTTASIVNALIRLRRDLTSPHLPQLAMILRQLINAIRGVRPLLGTKQYHVVSDSLPKWIDPQKPLGQDEARLLARVLTSLTTKSLVRYHSNESQKAESLARPFAGHAPYVLLAYFQLMNDPLSVLPMTMRRELEPGLFALCDMMGETGRDTLMIQSLDVGGKVLFKTLWRQYDKQRYVGGG